MIKLILLFNVFVVCYSKDGEFTYHNIITCHTTDFQCFKRQYKALRDHFFMGNLQMKIEFYEPYLVSYGDTGTCVRFTGVEDSELVAISMDSRIKEFTISLELPVRVQQVNGDGISCNNPDNDFTDIPPHYGALMKFAGNDYLIGVSGDTPTSSSQANLTCTWPDIELTSATVTVSYPYELQRKKNRLYMIMGEENVDVTLDMPDLSQHDKESELEAKLYAWSEWAYQMVQHVDIAQHVLMPFTGQMRKVTAALPISKLLMLYPDEEYSTMKFSFVDASVEIEKKR